MELLSLFEDTLRTRSLVQPGQRVLVAFSGGADSTTLLHLFSRLRESWSLEVAAAHLNHALRAEQSDADESHCRQVCSEWHIPFFSRKVEVKHEARQRRLSVEVAARELRYAFLQEVADAIEADVIALGHTRDDQVETVLLNLTRGAGTAGLAGMPMRRGRFIRPLLPVSRLQVRAYCVLHGLSFVEDASNLDPRYSRNRIRHHVLPELHQINPRADEAIERLALVIRDEETWWRNYLQSLEPQFTLRRTQEEWQLSLDWLAQQPEALQRRAIRYAVQNLSPEGWEVQFEQVERLREAIRAGRRAGVTLHGGRLHASVGQRVLRVWVKQESPSFAYERVVQIPGETPVPEAGMTLFAEHSPLPEARSWRQENWEVWCDASHISGQLRVRNWRRGDRMQPLGLLGHRKLSDIFVDRKVPLSLRQRIPVVCDAEGIIWIVGICLAHRVRCTTETTQAIHLWVQPRGGW
ncbi:MAG: tRNA(Ile)-lysidine synthase [Armatimonadota bacterium]|nr:MAG: tRNA(Ile)-lysidine synthase [Armatimonadota bacterium]